MFGLAAYGNTAAAFGTENQMNAVVDSDLQILTNGYIFTGPYNLLDEVGVGASVQYGRYSVPAWNGRGRPNITALNRNATPAAPFYYHRYPGGGLALPQNQAILAYLTNNLGASTEAEWILWHLCTTDWNRNLPAGQWDIILHATATVTPAVGAWSLNNAIAFDQAPVGGVYAVLGAHVFGANSVAFRVRFPMRRMWQGAGLHPGGPCFAAWGFTPQIFADNDYTANGVWGAFSSYQPPGLDLLGTAAVSTTYHLFMLARYLGADQNLLPAFVQTNY